MGDMCQSSTQRSVFVTKDPRPSLATEDVRQSYKGRAMFVDRYHRRCVLRQYAMGHSYWNLFQVISNTNKCVLKKLTETQAIWFLSLIGL